MKHLHADLTTLFRPHLPTYLQPSLPSGAPYVRPMHISAINANVFYSYNQYTFEITLEPITADSWTKLTKPKEPKPLRYHSVSNGIYSFWFYDFLPNPKLFSSRNEAYLDMFLNYSSAKRILPKEYSHILSIYPEYFI